MALAQGPLVGSFMRGSVLGYVYKLAVFLVCPGLNQVMLGAADPVHNPWSPFWWFPFFAMEALGEGISA